MTDPASFEVLVFVSLVAALAYYGGHSFGFKKGVQHGKRIMRRLR